MTTLCKPIFAPLATLPALTVYAKNQENTRWFETLVKWLRDEAAIFCQLWPGKAPGSFILARIKDAAGRLR